MCWGHAVYVNLLKMYTNLEENEEMYSWGEYQDVNLAEER